jgi:hypothetical protein
VASQAGDVSEWMSQIDYVGIIRTALMGLPLLTSMAGQQGKRFNLPATFILSQLGLAGLDALFGAEEQEFPVEDEGEEKKEDLGDNGDGDAPGDDRPPGDAPGDDRPPQREIFDPPPNWREARNRLAPFLGFGAPIPAFAAAAGAFAMENEQFAQWMGQRFGVDWANNARALGDALNYFNGLIQGRVGTIPASVRKSLRWGEQKINLSPADKAAIQQAHRGDIKPIQDQDKEKRVGDLRPSFRQLGTVADNETPEEAIAERVKFAAFNYVAPGYGASRDNVIVRANRVWDNQIRFNTPINTARYQKYPLRQLVDFRAPAGISASPAYTNPMSISLLRGSMQRAGISHDMLLRDVHNNAANYQPVMGINRINPSIPLSNMAPHNMDWRGYYATDAVNNPPEGTNHFIVRQRGMDPGPYKQLPSGFSADLPPYQFGTYYDNAYPLNGHPQFMQAGSRGSNDLSYAPISSRMPAGLDISSMSMLPRVPLNFSDPRTGKSVSGSTLAFPQTAEIARA